MEDSYSSKEVKKISDLYTEEHKSYYAIKDIKVLLENNCERIKMNNAEEADIMMKIYELIRMLDNYEKNTTELDMFRTAIAYYDLNFKNK